MFGLQPTLRKSIIRFNPKTITAVLDLCEMDEIADAFEELDMTGGDHIEINAVTAMPAHRTTAARPKEESLDKRVDHKLDTVVNMLGENTTSINKLTGFLQQALTSAMNMNSNRPHLGQAYSEPHLPLLYGTGNNQTFHPGMGNSNDRQRRNRIGVHCDFCQRMVTTHTTATCFKNPQFQVQQPTYARQPLGQYPPAQQPSQQEQQSSSQQYGPNPPRQNAMSNQDARLSGQQSPNVQTTNASTPSQQRTAPNNMRTLSTIDFDDGGDDDPSCLAEGAVSGEVVNRMLLDTGAAVSAISAPLFKRLPKELRDQLKDTPLKLRSATNARMETLGVITLDLQIGSEAPRGNKCEITGLSFVVVRELSAEVILGRDILRKYFDSINLRTHQLCYVMATGIIFNCLLSQ